jgi:hypothetical protein
MRRLAFATLASLLVPALPALAGEADVVKAEAVCKGNVCTFHVTVRHDDEGWDHYADRWEVVDPDGEVLGTRELAHPHVDEQPFTRSLKGVEIPEDVFGVTLRAHDSVHGYGGKTVDVRVVAGETAGDG